MAGEQPMQLVDSHCHFDLLDENISPEEVKSFIDNASEQGVKYFLNVCVSISRLEKVLLPAETYPFVFASVGLHPNDDNEETTVDELVSLAQHPRIVAIGETGLDYFRSSGELGWQRQRFRNHIAAAKQAGKPLIIHTRNAIEDTLAIMQEEGASEVGGVMHCFTENWQAAQEAIKMGFYISFSGIVTFKNASVIQEVASKIPLDRMLVETDAPYLAPVPKRGKPNEPAYVRHTAQFIADMRKITLDDVASATTENFFTLFKEASPDNV
jgi:TatD DNase family protein